MIKILFIGDVVAKLGRQAVAEALPRIKEENKVDLVLANAENILHGRGVSADRLEELRLVGVNGFTSGDHIFRHRDIISVIDDLPLARPANYPEDIPGSGIIELDLGRKGIVLVVNLLGLGLMSSPTASPASCPFRAIDKIFRECNPSDYSAVIVDIHAETTAEKAALAWYLDGRVSAVVGTHTHVPTCDQRILPKGTAFVSDIGMAGAYDSVLGVTKEVIIETLMYPYPTKFEWVEEGARVFNSVLIEIGKNRQAVSIIRIDKTFL